MRAYLLLFALLVLLYNSNLRPIASGDSLPAALLPFSVLLDGTVTLDRFGPWLQHNVPYWPAVVSLHRAHWYSQYPIAGPLLATPLYVPLLAVPGLRNMPAGDLVAVARVLEKIVASTLAALSAIAMLALLRRITSAGWAWALTALYALGTATWSTASQAMWQHTTGALAIIGSLAFLDLPAARARSARALWACGVCIAAAVAIRPTNVVLFVAVIAALLATRAPRDAYARVVAPVFVGAMAVLAYNLAVFGTPSGGYPAALTGDVHAGLAGILFSPGRGLFLYTPIAVFAGAAFLPRAGAMRDAHRALFVAAVVFVLLHIAAISAWPIWWGGYCWGPRMLTEIVPALVMLVAIGTPALNGRFARAAFGTVAAYCFFIQAVGVYFYPKGHWDHTPVPVNSAPERLWDWRDNPVSRAVAAGPAGEPLAVIGAGLRGGLPAAREKLRELRINAF